MTLSLKLNAAFTGSNLPPKAYPYFGMNEGTRALFDFTNPVCNPYADGNLATNAVFHDLVTGGANATIIAGSDGTRIVSAAGKAGLVWTSTGAAAALDLVSLGSTIRFERDEPWTQMLWMKQAADGLTTPYLPWLWRAVSIGANANGSEFWLDTGVTGNDPRMMVRPNGSSVAVGPISGPEQTLARGVPHLLALSYVPGEQMLLWQDGEAVAQLTSTTPASLETIAGAITRMAANGRGTIYRYLIEANAISGRSPEEAVTSEWGLFNETFV